MKTRRFASTAAATTVAASLTMLTASAAAQTAPLALDRFSPAPAGDRMFGVPAPFVAGDPALHVMLLGDYAHAPLVLVQPDDETNQGNIVEHQLMLHLNANLALWNRLGIDVDIPLAAAQGGESPGGLASPATAAFGDLRLGARVRLLGEYYDPFQLGVGGFVWLPTGDENAYVSDGSARGKPYVSIGGRVPHFLWTAAGGVEIRASQSYDGIAQGTMFQAGAGFGFLFGEDEQFQIGPEATVALTLDDVQSRTTNAELLLDARYRISDFELGAGVGPGIGTGIGTPDVRAVFMLAYTPEMDRDRDGDGIIDGDDACPAEAGVATDDPATNGCPPPGDRDGDGITDDVDACPDVPGVANADPAKNGCPAPSDRDGDGVLDAADACPDTAGVASDDPAKNGCPPDRDGDGVVDAEDACPDIPGVATTDPTTNGCPGDRDGDGIRDDKDACPDERGIPSADPAKNGCPGLVRVTDQEIEILQQVQFDTGRATIKPESDALLDQVAQVLNDHPEITRVEVQGHTDNRGGKALNLNLSKSRAKAVLEAMVKRNVAKERLTSQGYGPDKPIASNDDDAGRAKNRRVQFVILDKKPVAKP